MRKQQAPSLAAAAVAAALAACSPAPNHEAASAAADIPAIESAAELLLQAEEAANSGRGREAGAAYERALAIYESARDQSGQGDTLLGMATLARTDGQGEVAREIYSRARAVYESGGDNLGVGEVDFALAELERARFNNEAALAAFTSARAIFHDHGEWRREGTALLGIADSQRRLGEVLSAGNAVLRAQVLFDILGDRGDRALADKIWDELRTHIDAYDRMRADWAQPLGYGEQDVGALIEAQAFLGFAAIEALAGNIEEARDLFGRAADVMPEFGVHGGAVDALARLAGLEAGLGRAEAARDAYEGALAAHRRALGEPTSEAEMYEESTALSLDVRAALALAGLGDVELALGMDPRPRLAAARALAPEGQSAEVDAAVLLVRGHLEAQAGRADEAVATFRAAERLYARENLHAGAGRAQLARAGAELTRGDPDRARAGYKRALGSFLVAYDRVGQAAARLGLAETLAALGDAGIEAAIQYRMAARMLADTERPNLAAEALAVAESMR